MKKFENITPLEIKNKLAKSKNNQEILWFCANQADMVYLPREAFERAENIGHWLGAAGVMLEIAYPMMIQNLEATLNIPVKSLDLCTTWNNDRKVPDQMAKNCPVKLNQFGLFHPVKPGLNKLSMSWLKWFKKLVKI